MNTYLGSPFVQPPAGQEAAFFYHRRQVERSTWQPAASQQEEDIASVENLALVYDYMKQESGPAPGPDRVTYRHLGRRELYGILRPLSQAIV
jgi:hypothetical protein